MRQLMWDLSIFQQVNIQETEINMHDEEDEKLNLVRREAVPKRKGGN